MSRTAGCSSSRPWSTGSRPSGACQPRGISGRGRTQVRGGRGCRAPDRSAPALRSGTEASSSRSGASKLLTPQPPIDPPAPVPRTRHRLGQRHSPAPVQQVHVEVIGAQPPQTGLAGLHRPSSRGVAGHHLADEVTLSRRPRWPRRRAPRRRRRRTSRRCRSASGRSRCPHAGRPTRWRAGQAAHPCTRCPGPVPGPVPPLGMGHGRAMVGAGHGGVDLRGVLAVPANTRVNGQFPPAGSQRVCRAHGALWRPGSLDRALADWTGGGPCRARPILWATSGKPRHSARHRSVGLHLAAPPGAAI
jgi:hypothetical protein